jgi:hypothetical protein
MKHVVHSPTYSSLYGVVLPTTVVAPPSPGSQFESPKPDDELEQLSDTLHAALQNYLSQQHNFLRDNIARYKKKQTQAYLELKTKTSEHCQLLQHLLRERVGAERFDKSRNSVSDQTVSKGWNNPLWYVPSPLYMSTIQPNSSLGKRSDKRKSLKNTTVAKLSGALGIATAGPDVSAETFTPQYTEEKGPPAATPWPGSASWTPNNTHCLIHSHNVPTSRRHTQPNPHHQPSEGTRVLKVPPFAYHRTNSLDPSSLTGEKEGHKESDVSKPSTRIYSTRQQPLSRKTSSSQDMNSKTKQHSSRSSQGSSILNKSLSKTSNLSSSLKSFEKYETTRHMDEVHTTSASFMSQAIEQLKVVPQTLAAWTGEDAMFSMDSDDLPQQEFVEDKGAPSSSVFSPTQRLSRGSLDTDIHSRGFATLVPGIFFSLVLITKLIH